MKKKGPTQLADDLLPITPDTNIADLVGVYPEVLDALIGMGFEPLKSAMARRTVARLFTLEQVAGFRGVNLEEMLATIRAVAGVEVCEESSVSRPPSGVSQPGPVPDLQGDVRFLGLVPCPIRNVLMDKFDVFVQKQTVTTGSTVAWWMAGEGTGTADVRVWLSGLIADRDFDSIPDLLLAVGTEIFMHRKYGKSLYDEGIWGPIQTGGNSHPDLKNLQDPGGKLVLQFAVLFTFSCRPDRLPCGSPPSSWADLTRPEFKGQVALPSLDLPIMPDLLGALYHHLGEEQFAALASNLSPALHPAQASPRTGLKDVPGVVILPLHFSKIAIASGAVQILPQDGPVAVPAYLAMRSDAGSEVKSVAAFLSSREFLEPLWKFGSFVPNLADFSTDVRFDQVITRPWESVFIQDPDAFTDRLVATINAGGVS